MRKPRILIADDDTMVRIGLKTVINWEENGFVLVGDCLLYTSDAADDQ